MDNKKCFKCDETKPLTEFYKHSKMKDGRVNKCKVCNKNDVIKNRLDKVEYYRDYDKTRNQTQHRKDVFSKKQKKARSTDYGKLRMKCYKAVSRAIKKGILARREKCDRCPVTENIQAHHDDHERPLDIMWLCPICHAARHKEIGVIN